MSLTFRPLERADFPLVATWLGRPHVERWWKEDPDPDAVAARYGPAVDGTDPTEMFVVERAAESIGMIQRYRIADYQDWARSLSVAAVDATAFGIDYLIGEPDLTGRGIGPAMIDAFVRLSAERYPEAASVAVDVDQLNRRSWRVLEKAGFERVWAGWLHSDDPSDDGPAFVYVRRLENR